MEKVGIKQLKRDASAILKRVRENNETIEVTYRGDTIAQIVPVITREERRACIEATLAERRRLRDEIAKRVKGPVDAVDLVRDQRRGLGDVRS